MEKEITANIYFPSRKIGSNGLLVGFFDEGFSFKGFHIIVIDIIC